MDHPDTANSYNNVASGLQAQGKAGEALPLYRQALLIREKVLGLDHPDTAASYNNVAYCLGRQGKPPEAVPLFRQSRLAPETVRALAPPPAPDSSTKGAGRRPRQRSPRVGARP